MSTPDDPDFTPLALIYLQMEVPEEIRREVMRKAISYSIFYCKPRVSVYHVKAARKTFPQ